MKWIELTKNKAQKEYDKFITSNNKREIIGLNDDYLNLRRDVLIMVESILGELNVEIDSINKLAYEFDYRFALKLYFLLNEKYGFNNYYANSDNIWIYMQVCVLPDLLYYRWGNSFDHVYKRTGRLWLKSLWWYIFLAWKDSKELTIRILQNNNSDTIVQLVERTGKYGYRVELYKEILYMRYVIGIDKINTELFKKMMTINTARMKVIDPYLFNGGIPAYVRELYKEVLVGEKDG